MKLIPLLFAALSVNASAQISSYKNFIYQIQQGTGVRWDMPVAVVGSAPSLLEIDEKGSLFQLWTIEKATAKSYLLDQKLVGPYLPKADIKITTLDPYALVHRTRVDKPFKVEIQVANLHAGVGIQDSATKVLLEQHIQSYVNDQIPLDPVVVASNVPLHSSYISQNGPTVLNYSASSLTASDPTKALGEEHFIVHALADASIAQTQIASESVQVWPVASGSILGIKPGEKLRFRFPILRLNLNDLYPRSDTALMVYKGSQISGEGKLVKAFPMDRDRSFSTVIDVTELSSAIEEDGEHTLALMSTTVYGTELLCDPITFSVDWTIKVNSMLVTFSNGTE